MASFIGGNYLKIDNGTAGASPTPSVGPRAAVIYTLERMMENRQAPRLSSLEKVCGVETSLWRMSRISTTLASLEACLTFSFLGNIGWITLGPMMLYLTDHRAQVFKLYRTSRMEDKPLVYNWIWLEESGQ
jgi:hypothetical protein